jgi:asparagine synthase (glutamine-hydrolysing)
LDLSLYLQNTLLRDADQMSMAHALEVRVPFLDHVLLEELARFHGSMKLSRRGQPNKWLLVALAGDKLPPSAVRRAKMGFVFPWERWLRRDLRDSVASTLDDPGAVADAGLMPTAVAAVWQQFLAGQGGFRYSDILALVHLVRWVREHRLKMPGTQAAEFHAQRN